MTKGRALCAACLAAVLAYYLWIAWAVPYSPIDDMQWGLDEPGLRWWLGGELNGRYAGNFFAVILNRSQLVKTLVMDIYFTASGDILIIDLNPWGEPTDPLMLRSWDRDWSKPAGIVLMDPPTRISGDVNISF